MSKRFIDTTLWEKEWFYNLTPGYKLAVKYIFERCDEIGRWSPNFVLADHYIGGKVNWDKMKNEILKNKVEILEDGKWWLKEFTYFQYGVLSLSCNPHKKYIKLLEDCDLLERVPNTLSGSVPSTLQEQEQDKDKDKEKKKRISKNKFEEPTLEDIKKNMLDRRIISHESEAQKFLDHHGARGWILSNGKKMKSWTHAVGTWVANMETFSPSNAPVSEEKFKEHTHREKEAQLRKAHLKKVKKIEDDEYSEENLVGPPDDFKKIMKDLTKGMKA